MEIMMLMNRPAVFTLLTTAALPLAAETASYALEEVVVTARMRSESLQDVPISETAFSAQAIEDSRIESADDFLQLTPNVTLANSQSAGVSFMTIRGISQVRNGEAPVAVVVDGVLQINNRQLTQAMIDMESIEVLRGPQGALYGRNAAGGAILINSRMPTDEFEGYVRATYGKGNERGLQFAAGGPIVADTLKYRVAAKYQDIDGYLDNKQLRQEADALEDISMRGILQWAINDQWELMTRASMVRTEGGGLNFQYQSVEFDGDSCNTNNPFGGPVPDANNVVREFCSTNLGYNERDIDELSLKLVYDGDTVSWTNTASYNDVMEYGHADQFPYTNEVDVFGAFDGTQTQFVEVEAWSLESRLASNHDGALQWMIGAYYLETDRFISTTVGDDNRQGIVRIERQPAFGNPLNPTTSFIADDNNNTAWALFGNVSYDISDALELALALRYDKDDREQTVSPLNTAGLPNGCSQTNTANCIREQSFSELQPKVTLRYDISDDANIYASYGEGFRSGQFNQFGVASAAAAAGVIGVRDEVDAEITKTSELGIKSEFFDNRLRVNAALFRTETNPLYFVFVGEVGAQVLVNIEDVELTGGEVEAFLSVSEGLDLYAAFGITDSEIKSNSLNPATVGNEAPYVAKNTFNLGAQYRTDLTAGLGLVARVDYERRGAQFWDPENSTERSALNLVNARLGIEDLDGRWSLTAAVRNLGDEEYNSEWVLGGFAHPAQPRTWHIDARVNF
jgi:iron complex outermembrane receptor protein